MFRALLCKSVKASLVFALMGSTSVLAQSGGWKLSESNGQVSVGRQGVTKIAISGQNLRAGDVIRTGARSRAVVTRGDQYMVVAANSHIKLANPETDGVMTQVFNYLGNVLFKVDKRKAKHFGVETPYMAAVVKGTTFNVSVGPQGSTVQVTEGAVEVSTLDGGAVELLRPGMIGMVAGADPFAMTIMDNGTRRIESPNRGKTPPKSLPSRVISSNKPSGSVSNNAPVVISRTITNQPVQLAALTNGLIEGQSPGSKRVNVDPQLGDNTGQQNFLLATEDMVTNSGRGIEVSNLRDSVRAIETNDGNNDGGNDPGGQDPSNPGQGNGNGNGGGNGNSGKDGDGNNGGGNDPGGQDPSNPGQGNGNGNGGGNGNSGKDGDGNNGGGNDPGGQDPSNPGRGNGNGNGGGNGNSGKDGDGNNAEDPSDPDKGNGNGNGGGNGNKRNLARIDLGDPVGGFENEIRADPGQNSPIGRPQFILDSQPMHGGSANPGNGIDN